ncbi:hypothetical protein BH09ACT10_BH09ACT10_03890 [soil metagenome]
MPRTCSLSPADAGTDPVAVSCVGLRQCLFVALSLSRERDAEYVATRARTCLPRPLRPASFHRERPGPPAAEGGPHRSRISQEGLSTVVGTSWRGPVFVAAVEAKHYNLQKLALCVEAQAKLARLDCRSPGRLLVRRVQRHHVQPRVCGRNRGSSRKVDPDGCPGQRHSAIERTADLSGQADGSRSHLGARR